MGLPGHRRTSSHKRRRASHFALQAKHHTLCSHCQQPVPPHQACLNCGYYRGRQILKIKSKLSAKAKAKAKAKAETKKEEEKEQK